MKKTLTLSALILLAGAYSQAQNTFPATGNVGIGTSSPGMKLQINTTNILDGMQITHNGSGFVRINANSLSGGSYNDITKFGDAGIIYGGAGLPPYGSSTNYGFVIAPWANGTSGLRLDKDGNVGVGVSVPATKFHINTTSDRDGMQITHNSSGFVKINANSFSAGAYNGITKSGDAGIIFGGAGLQSSGSYANYEFVIAPHHSSTAGLRIDPEGNVTIGTNNANGYQLAVNGNAIFTGVKVKQYGAWPDYVFDAGYALPSLADVEAYTQTHKHLPNVPSAEDIKEGGLDLGESQAVLLKKIEELTLYAIQQQKEINQQQKDISQQQKEINELRKEIKQ